MPRTPRLELLATLGRQVIVFAEAGDLEAAQIALAAQARLLGMTWLDEPADAVGELTEVRVSADARRR